MGVHAFPIRPHRAVCFCARRRGAGKPAFLSLAAAGTFVQNHQTTQHLGRAQGPADCPPVGTGASGSSGQISQAAGPCLMSVAPGVRLSPTCLASPLPAPRVTCTGPGGGPRGRLLLSSRGAEPGPPWLGSKEFLMKPAGTQKAVFCEGLRPAEGPPGSGGHLEIQLSRQRGLQPAPLL